nr:MAG TPA: hypothetical protein [Caudoviricetes sp.]
MDITLERILSLIPKKSDGSFVHGSKKEFCEKIGAPTNIINEWVRGASRSYRNYLYQISEANNVSLEWLKGESDEKKVALLKTRQPDEIKKVYDFMETCSTEEVKNINLYIDFLKSKRGAKDGV